MSTIENTLSTSKLHQSKEYREAFVSAFSKRYIPFQIRTIRKKRGMSQLELAKESKITQGVISRAEDPDNGNLAFNTVLRIAAGFDLAFVGKFVRFSELLKVVDEMSEDDLDLPSFVEECAELGDGTLALVGSGAEEKAQPPEIAQIPHDESAYAALLNRSKKRPPQPETILRSGAELSAMMELG